jgi:hypothetical protein
MSCVRFFGKWLGDALQGAWAVFGVLATLVTGALWKWQRSSPESFKNAASWLGFSAEQAMTDIPWHLPFYAACCWLIVRVFYTPYRFYVRQAMKSEALTQRVTTLRALLHEKKHSLDTSDPAFGNMLAVLCAFEELHGEPPETRPQVFITASDDSQRIATVVSCLASVGSKCVVTQLDTHIDPDYRRLALENAEPGLLVFHMTNGFPRQAVFEKLAPVFRTRRSDELAPWMKPHHLWLQFGPGMKWSSDL